MFNKSYMRTWAERADRRSSEQKHDFLTSLGGAFCALCNKILWINFIKFYYNFINLENDRYEAIPFATYNSRLNAKLMERSD